jgi:type II secretory pathway pseudopilin PulG
LNRNTGFTLIETLIATAVLVCGLVAVASVFSFAVRTNISNRQMAIATALLYDKIEEFRSAQLADPLWNVNDGSDQFTQDGKYTREWHVRQVMPRSVTVIVYVHSNPLTHRQTELIRATTLASQVF